MTPASRRERAIAAVNEALPHRSIPERLEVVDELVRMASNNDFSPVVVLAVEDALIGVQTKFDRRSDW